ncbi:MAG: hypothetical protein DRJ69_02755 [Thermoprotei archaeon]|nr:MAG: hypothetical protein DRJ69_02755 [Thermoprotei archaeon]
MGVVVVPVIVDIERGSEKELEGGFRVSGRNVNLWVRVYHTNYGKRVRLTVSYNDGYRWVNTPPIWLGRDLLDELVARLSRISAMLI